VRPQDAALGECGLDLVIGEIRNAETERPLGPRIVLRLDGAQPGDDVGWTTESRLRQLVIELARPQETGLG
jgi:hypothetical protein